MNSIVLVAVATAFLAACGGPDVPDIGTQRWSLCVLNEMGRATTEDDVQYIASSCAAFGNDHTAATAYIVPATYKSGSDCALAMSRRLPILSGKAEEMSEQVTAACFTLYDR